MPITCCRVCGNEFFDSPLLRYNNMPSCAQFLPNADSVKEDKTVDLNVYQCSGCGLVQLDNDPVYYYRDVVRAAAFSEEMTSFRKNQFATFIQRYDLRDKKIVEIGCGRGEYLSLLAQSCAYVYGLEHHKSSVEECLRQNLNVSIGFVEDDTYKIPNHLFDAFYMLNFLEHLPNPNATLKGIYNNLEDHAIGIIEVPNFDMIIKKSIFSEFVSDHLTYFTESTLRSTLVNNGFDVIECNEIWHDYILSAVVKKRKKLDLYDFHNRQSQLINEIHTFINLFNENRIAIWGASHQAFAIMALANLSGKIKYVIDSAKFKQNKYTPATHIPIVSPSTLILDPVDAVIIMASSYSDEVAMILKRDFDRHLNIAILRDYGLQHLQNEIN